MESEDDITMNENYNDALSENLSDDSVDDYDSDSDIAPRKTNKPRTTQVPSNSNSEDDFGSDADMGWSDTDTPRNKILNLFSTLFKYVIFF